MRSFYQIRQVASAMAPLEVRVDHDGEIVKFRFGDDPSFCECRLPQLTLRHLRQCIGSDEGFSLASFRLAAVDGEGEQATLKSDRQLFGEIASAQKYGVPLFLRVGCDRSSEPRGRATCGCCSASGCDSCA